MWVLLLLLVLLLFGFGAFVQGLKWLLIAAVVVAVLSAVGYYRDRR